MKAVLLVGGFGTRLRPLTLDMPKQMLPIGPVTMLERVVRHLGNCGVDEVVLSLGYRPEPFRDAFPDGRCAGVELGYAVEPEPLDTAGAIAFAARSAGFDETFFAFNGDVLTDVDLSGQWARHREFGGEATIGLTPVDDPSRFGVVPIDPDGKVIDFVEKPPPGTAPSNWINAGMYVLEPSVLDRIPEGSRMSIEREVFPRLAAEGVLFALQHDGYFLDAGTPEAYLQAHLDLLSGQRRDTENGIDPSAAIAPDASVERSFVGAGVTVGAGATVRDSVVMEGCTLSDGSTVDRSIVGSRSVVDPGVRVEGLSVVGFDQRVTESLDAQLLPPADSW